MSSPHIPSSQLTPFSFARLPVRGRLLRLNGLDAHVPALVGAPEHLQQSLAELLAVAALLSFDSCKATNNLSAATLQIQHSGAGVLMFAHCKPQNGRASILKAYANPAAAETPFNTLAGIPAGPQGGGLLAVTLEQVDQPMGAPDQRIQSILPVAEESVSRCIEAYYNNAVQTPTYLRVVSGYLTDERGHSTQACGAFFLQRLPEELSSLNISDDDWLRLGLLLDTITPEEILAGTISETTLLQRLFAEDDLTLFPSEDLNFQADNPRPRMLAALAALPPEELQDMLAEGPITLTDETSGLQETFNAIDLHDFMTVNQA